MRGFRKGGFGGLGVDGLAKEAGVTSGAFYVHFGSKSEAFSAAVAEGMAELKDAVLASRAEHGKAWWPEFVRFYLGVKLSCDLADSCGLQSLSPDVARADDAARIAFEQGLEEVAQAVVEGPRSPGAPRDAAAALVAMATLVGGVTLARAMHSPEASRGIADAIGRALLGARWDADPGA